MPGAVGKEAQSGIERQKGQNYQAWRTREEKNIMRGELEKEELAIC